MFFPLFHLFCVCKKAPAPQSRDPLILMYIWKKKSYCDVSLVQPYEIYLCMLTNLKYEDRLKENKATRDAYKALTDSFLK